jgi:hypothetical protein
MPVAAKSALARKSRSKAAPAVVLYLYAISPLTKQRAPQIAAEGIDGSAPVEAVRCGGYLCWVSRVSKSEFADHITERMQDLEWLATASLRHQRTVAEISAKLPALPARFATVFVSEASLEKHVKERETAIGNAFKRVADADEWGVKVFAIAAPRTRTSKPPASGSEYLKRKAEQLQPRTGKKLDVEVGEFVSALTKLAVADSPGGKASAGQPGLLWHGSFLIRKKDHKKLTSLLSKFATRWRDARRIDCSGPWPPYSFVGEHV